MAEFRRVTDRFAVSGQLAPDDAAAAAADGFTLIINNRPDGEVPGQPTSAQMAEAARAAGLAYRQIPVIGLAGPDQLAATREAVAGAEGKVLAFCRTGTRSITTWARGELAAGARSRAELLALTRAAGYDLGGILGG